MRRREARCLPDAAHRRQAATDFGRNLVVLAGAGTGKTALLVERALVALGAGLARLPELAAITFTEKAAGEMRERLADGLEELRGRAQGEDPSAGQEEESTPALRAFWHLRTERGIGDEEIASRALEALGQLDRAPVQTIHTFCAQLLRAHPTAAEVDPDFVVDPGEHFDSLFDDAWERFLARELRPDAERTEIWRQVLLRFDPKTLREIARQLSGASVPASLLTPGAYSPDARELLSPLAREIADELATLSSQARGLSAKPVAFLASIGNALAAFVEHGVEGLRKLAAIDAALPRFAATPPAPNARLEGVTADRFKRTTRRAARLVRRLLEIDEAPLAALVDAISPFCLEFREELLRRGFVSFDGLLTLCRDLLRDDTGVRDALKGRYRMLLVDEFQDTDPVQYDIVLFLGEKPGGVARDPYDAELEAGRLFIVGDPKQSIYRFRGADYAAFDRAVARVQEQHGALLDLTANFRGVPEVIRPVNRLFEGPDNPTWRSSRFQPPYRAIDAVRCSSGSLCVELWTLDLPEDTRVEDRRAAEGRAIAREIHRLVMEARERRFRDVTILLRSFTPLPAYIRPLRDWRIPFVVDGGREFLERSEVVQLLSVLRAVANPSDPVAILAFLRCPAGAVPDVELAEWGATGGGWEAHIRPDREHFPNLARALELLRGIREEVEDRPLSVAVRVATDRSGLVPLNATAYEGAQRVANLRKLAATAAELSRDGRLSFLDVLDSLEEARASDVESDSPLSDEGADVVRILTIHKAKGLENDVVVLPDLARGPHRSWPRLDGSVARTSKGEFLALAVGRCRNVGGAWLELENEGHDKAEQARLLYVALTRARERLVVVGGRSARQAAWLEALAPWGYDPARALSDGALLAGGEVLHRIVESGARAAEAPAEFSDDPFEAADAYRKAAETLRAKARPELSAPSGQLEDHETGMEELAERFLGGDRDVARAAGTVIHRILQNWNGDANLAGERVRSLALRAAAEARADPGEVEREASEILQSFISSPLVSVLSQVEVLGREIPLLLGEPETAWRGSIDLVYRDRGGQIVVADYKTDRDAPDEVILARYEGQLRVYREGVRRALHLPAPPRTELWLLRAGRIVTI